ncbi:PRELI-like family-domain-containing protein [Baffinella frigidus]|nr:PRELI-like family-domain-containing protein [Cryptophyta sp. CCMP2293]
MVKQALQDILYNHPFAAVTASLWSKYDGHKYVRDVEVLDRHIDEEGRLHSTRLLTMKGSLPAFIQPFVPVRQMHMLETVVVDPATQQMSVTTCNINCTSVMHALSESTYTPAPAQPDQTRYQISIFVKAFPKRRPADTDRTGPLSAAEIAAQAASWKPQLGEAAVKVGYIAGKVEAWAASKLLSNVAKGEKYIEGFCRRWRESHLSFCDEAAKARGEAGDGAAGGRGGGWEEGEGGESDEGNEGRERDGVSTGATCQGGGGGQSLRDLIQRESRLARLVQGYAGVSGILPNDAGEPRS